MSQNKEVVSRFVEIYRQFKQKQILNLDNKMRNLQAKLENELGKLDKLSSLKEKLIQEEESHNEIYNSLLQIVKSRGILFNIPNNNFQINEWDNLIIKDFGGLYSLTSKGGTRLYTFEKKYYDAIKCIIEKYSYSAIVIRKDIHFIKIQLRILKSNLEE